ncbi:SLATT domain-containing protein [Vibrio sp. Vb2853]|uniref:SLATT domain-containing protein n=1 Tax=Vibrio TaxID=662 RepID=UPI001CDD7150|nr:MULTISPECIES: SLATT domain-containing protein [Vibrio]MCA2483285.1 SLATT domain-containing protein [Vibrio alginolyticus]MDW1617151.1 SLATT domain-containing protein [Vibrio sp. Vb2881]MDW1621868.1 SLATT domain-containing protein [Vibrio sp. Vb2864]MDW1694005.1 SLATT domain-containing protein [Vibrio sp. Vb2853]MDW1712713.1 SLATT domain-containing protein [Vibrio sp. Vb2865]
MKELDNDVEELLRRVKMTTSSRYGASLRFKFHHRVSQWTVAFISIALLIIPMAQAWGLAIGIDNQQLNFIQSILAVLVLVYSLLLGQENFISRSEAMQRNGVELGKFARKLKPYIRSCTETQYSELVEEYYAILEKYENHEIVDYYATKLEVKPTEFAEYFGYIWFSVKFWYHQLKGLMLYFPAWLFVGYVLYIVFASLNPAS